MDLCSNFARFKNLREEEEEEKKEILIRKRQTLERKIQF